MLLTEGFDCPPVDCIVTARPTKSTALYTQMIGRGTRLHPGKRDCLVLDVVGQAGRHDLVTAAGLFGVTPRQMADRTITEALDEQQREDDEREVRLHAPHGRLVARPVDLFKQRPLHWVEDASGRFVLAVSDGRITLEQRPRGWTATLSRYNASPVVIARELPLEYAQGVAEDRARQMGASYLADPNAAWRRRPASEKQLGVLRRRGAYITPGMTAGEASDLISAGQAWR
jgi:hypothetical protein